VSEIAEQKSVRAYEAAINESEIVDLLQSVDHGELVVTPTQPIEDGIVEYKTVNDWLIFVFFDKGKWIYVDSVVAPDGREVDIDDIQGSISDHSRPMSQVGSYKPKTVITKARWGIINITSAGGVS
jgi:hypothetical protein